MKAARFAPSVGLVGAALLLGTGIAGDSAEARLFKGTKRGDHVIGTKRDDKIRLGRGNDRAHGKAGADLVEGGAGRDRVMGGRGSDRLLGGPGADRLDAADGKRDRAIKGGPGRDVCIVDLADLRNVLGCEKLTAYVGPDVLNAPPRFGDPGGGGIAPEYSLPHSFGDGVTLTMSTASGLYCASSFTVCMFEVSGEGADVALGAGLGRGGVTAGGSDVQVHGHTWTVQGSYGCSADGYLRIVIADEWLDVPVTCVRHADRWSANGPGA